MRKNTDQIEMVETHNLSLCLKRLRDAVPYDSERWERALFHALMMSHVCLSYEQSTKLREALNIA